MSRTLACCALAVMATVTPAANRTMIKISWDPGRCSMTGSAVFTCRNMLGVFAGSGLSIMATIATLRSDTRVVKSTGCEGVSVMAINTVL